MSRKVCVFAASGVEAREWGNENNLAPSDYRYINRPDQLRGLRGCEYVVTGTYNDRPYLFLREVDALIVGLGLVDVSDQYRRY